MLALERQQLILDLLGTAGSARVTDLARKFGVAEETIRRDLDKLEAEGKLQRSHGGAVIPRYEERESPYWWREVSFEREKVAIAHEAISRIGSGDRILLDASTTAWHMAKRLSDLPVTVVTNSIRVVAELAKAGEGEILCLGGELTRASLSFVGPVAERMLDQYHVDKLFLSCRGVDLDRGLSDSTEAQASLRRCMIERADKKYLLLDHSKFGVKSLARICDLNCFDEIITDNQTDRETLEALEKLGVKTTVVGVS